MVTCALFFSTLRHFGQNCPLFWGCQRSGETDHAIFSVLTPILYCRRKNRLLRCYTLDIFAVFWRNSRYFLSPVPIFDQKWHKNAHSARTFSLFRQLRMLQTHKATHVHIKFHIPIQKRARAKPILHNTSSPIRISFSPNMLHSTTNPRLFPIHLFLLLS